MRLSEFITEFKELFVVKGLTNKTITNGSYFFCTVEDGQDEELYKCCTMLFVMVCSAMILAIIGLLLHFHCGGFSYIWRNSLEVVTIGVLGFLALVIGLFGSPVALIISSCLGLIALGFTCTACKSRARKYSYKNIESRLQKGETSNGHNRRLGCPHRFQNSLATHEDIY